jgi:Holliday junction resolvasome RuvABC endonuclease subunit
VIAVLGVDQSLTCTGVARVVGGTVSVARIRTEPTEAGDLVALRDRIRSIVGQTLRFAPARCVSIIEAPIVVRNGKGGAQLERAWLFGLLVDQLLLRGPVVQVRTTTRAMYATSNGRAEKKEVLAAMRATFPDLRIPDDNAADALALAAMGARWMGSPIDGVLSKKQTQAMVAVRWPEKEN